jgi:hypothetical protein
MRIVPNTDFTAGLVEVGVHRCKCGFSGLEYAFGTKNGKRMCVRCCGSPVAEPSAAMRDAGKRGAEKANARRRGMTKINSLRWNGANKAKE